MNDFIIKSDAKLQKNK